MINFFTEEIDFNLKKSDDIKVWLVKCASIYSVDIQIVNYVFSDDNYVLEVNKEHLNHDFYTDIITFDLRDAKGQPIEADIFVSIDRVKDNSISLDIPFETELNRVLVHGLLHLIGYSDKSEEEALEMRAQEDKCLSLLSQSK